jgi:hypothetical protein
VYDLQGKKLTASTVAGLSFFQEDYPYSLEKAFLASVRIKLRFSHGV